MARRNEPTHVTEVEIYGAKLSLLSGEDDAYAREIASFVDRKMNEIASEHNLADTGKIAIMAALDIAHDVLRAREARTHDLARTHSATDRLGRCLDADGDEDAA